MMPPPPQNMYPTAYDIISESLSVLLFLLVVLVVVAVVLVHLLLLLFP